MAGPKLGGFTAWHAWKINKVPSALIFACQLDRKVRYYYRERDTETDIRRNTTHVRDTDGQTETTSRQGDT